MKRIFTSIFLLIVITANAQVKPKPKDNNQPANQGADKMIEEALKGENMTEEEKEEMRKLMKGMMPGNNDQQVTQTPVDFSDNKLLIPKKDMSRISSIPAKVLTDTDIKTLAGSYYSKILVKAPAAEKTIINNTITKATTASAMMNASITAALQSQPHTAMALASKAVQADPANLNYQNNLAALLSQYGYPEKAIPLLNKLQKQLPANSTVRNNLGYAWLQLGQLDSARRHMSFATRRNPHNPEAQATKGLVEEAAGKTNTAGDHYAGSYNQHPNSFSEKLANNSGNKTKLNTDNFDKLKDLINVYEYFPYNWVTLPKLGNSVETYSQDMAILNGYDKMLESLRDKVEQFEEAASTELDQLTDEDETVVIKTMMKEFSQGISFMSKPAVYITMILNAWIVKWEQQYISELNALNKFIDNEQQKVSAAINRKNSQCQDWDAAANRFLRTVNPRIREFHLQKIEEYRQWLNAYCTWTWFVVGNPRNLALTQCAGWTRKFVEIITDAVQDLQRFRKHCVENDDSRANSYPEPELPKFHCPIVVAMPIGLDKLKLMAASIKFEANGFNIPPASSPAIPNFTVSYGFDNNDISEPGKYNTPYFKTSEGSIAPSETSGGDEELAPLADLKKQYGYDDELTPISTLADDGLAPLDKDLLQATALTPLPVKKIREAEAARKLLKKLMSAPCDLKKADPKIKDRVSMDEMAEMGQALEEQNYIDRKIRDLKKQVDDMKKAADEMEDANDNELAPLVSKKELQRKAAEREAFVNKLAATPKTGEAPVPGMKSTAEKNGPIPAINNGLQAPGQNNNVIKGLFN